MNHHLAKIADKNKNPKTFLGIDCSSVQCGLILESACPEYLDSAENHHFVTKKIGESVQNFSSESAMLKILGNNLIKKSYHCIACGSTARAVGR